MEQARGAAARRGGFRPARHLIYWVLPTFVSVALAVAYFSGVGPLRDLVASPVNREFGLLEHLQGVILLVTAGGGVVGMRRAENRVERAVSALVALGAAFLLLEEIDFGLHYWEYLFGESGFVTLNIHNQGENLDVFKTGSDILVVLLFLVLPLVASRASDPRLAYFAPPPLIAATVLAGLAVSAVVRMLDDASPYAGGPLTNNLSEFRETFTYYALMLYGLELSLRRKWPAAAQSGKRLR